jgi:hypothetical protein
MPCATPCPTCRPSATRTWLCAIGITTCADQDLLLFDGAEALIDELADAGYMLAVATGKTRAGLNRAFEVSGLGRASMPRAVPTSAIPSRIRRCSKN